MGIAVALFYVPILGVMIVAALLLGALFDRGAQALGGGLYWLTLVLGAIVSVALTLFAAARTPSALLTQIATTLLFPFVVSFCLKLVASALPAHRARAMTNALAVGALQAVWVLPIALLFRLGP
jgi:hypothetical protein